MYLFVNQYAFGIFQRIEVENHPIVSLNGVWKIYTVPWNSEDLFDPNKSREDIVFPQYGMNLGLDGNEENLIPRNNLCYWIEKTVEVPVNYAGKNIFLILRFASFSIEVYVNDAMVGQFSGITSPVKFNVTSQIKTGQSNTIRIKMQDWRAAISPDKPFDASPTYGYSDKPIGSIVYPINMQFADGCIGIKDDVYIVAIDDVYVEDVFVKPSIRKKNLEVEITVKNISDKLRHVIMRSEVQERISGNRIFEFPERSFTLEPNELVVLVLSKDNPNLKFWNPNDPHLYDCKIELVENDLIIDTKKQHFGFREVWTQGSKLMLNGYSVKLFQLGTFMTDPGWYDLDRKKHIAKIRKFYQEDVLDKGLNSIRWTGGILSDIYMDVADEMGVMITIEPDTTHCFGADFLSDVFWERVYGNCEGFVKLYRNNPSVIVYSAGNEILIWQYHNKREEIDYALDKYFNIQNLFHQLDPTRPVMFEGNGALENRNVDIYNNHAYEKEDAREWPVYSFITDPLNIEYHANPATDFWGGKKVESAQKPWHGDKPMILGEMFSMYKLPVESFSYIGGEDIYRNMLTDLSGYYQATAELLVNLVAGYRYRGVVGQDPWYLFPLNEYNSVMVSSQKRAYKLTKFYVYDKFCRYFPNQNVSKRIICFNDAYDPCSASIVFDWTLSIGNSIVDKGVKDIGQVLSGDSPMVSIDFHSPIQTGEYTMNLKMIRNGSPVYEEELPIWIYQDLTKLKIDVKSKKLACYDPKKSTSKILKDILTEVDIIKSPLPDKRHEILIIGEGSYDQACESGSQKLLRWVAQGGKLLVLGQNYETAPFDLGFSVERGNTYTAFIRSKGHPVFCNLKAEDILTWSDEFTVGYNSFRKSKKISLRSLADTGYGHDGLVYSVMSEQTLGRGAIIYCQFRIIERYLKEPAAQRLLNNIIEYLCAYSQSEQKSVYVIGHEQGYEELFSKFGVGVKKMPEKIVDNTSAGVLWIEGSDPNTAEWIVQNNNLIKKFVSAGGTLFVDNLQNACVDALNVCFEKQVKLKESQLRISHLEYGSGERERLLWGLSLFDFTWDSYITPFRTEKIVKNTIVPLSCDTGIIPLLIEPIRVGYRYESWCKYATINTLQKENILNPNAGYSLIKYLYGKGSVYISMLQLSNGFYGNERNKSERILSALLNNLDVEMDLNKIGDEWIFPAKQNNFVPFGLSFGDAGEGGVWVKCFKKDRVRWQLPGLKEQKYRVSFNVACSGAANPSYIPWKIFIDGKEMPVENKIKNVKSVLKGTGWEYFGGDLFVDGIYNLNDKSVLEIESQGPHLLVYNLKLYSEKKQKY